MRGAFWFTLVLVMLAIVCSPAAAGAGQLRVDFESGPPLGTAVNDDYRTHPPARLTMSDLWLSAARVASVRARVTSLRSAAVAGIAFRLIRGGRLIARHGASIKHVHNGSRSFRWRIPRLQRGNYRLAVNLMLATTSATGQPSASTVHATSSTTVSVGRRA